MKYSFIFPVHNEELYLLPQMKFFFKFVCQFKDFEIVFIENGSSDQSWEIIQKLTNMFSFVRSFSTPVASYGEAVKLGVVNAQGDKIFILNVDYYDFYFIKKSIDLLDHLDIIIGSKTLASSKDLRPPLRRITTYFFNVFLRIVLNYPGTDTHGIKAFKNSKTLKQTAYQCYSVNELFDTELLIRLTQKGLLFVEIPQKIKELRPTRYVGFRRIKATFLDLVFVIIGKYFYKGSFYTHNVEADDFGISSLVNKTILKKVENNSVQIIAIMANLVSESDIKKLLAISDKVSFALHFNLLRGKPVSPANKVKSLVDKDGFFFSLPFFICRLLLGLISLEEIKIEFLSQYKKLSIMGIFIEKINSEQHLHLFIPINYFVKECIGQAENIQIRSLQSTQYYLQKKPLRFIIFLVIYYLSKIKFYLFLELGGKKNYYNTYITHPGSNYD